MKKTATKSLQRETQSSMSQPSMATPIYAFIMLTHPDCIRSLWRWNKLLCEEPDLRGWNLLHYAVKLGLAGVVSDMLRWKKSLAYLPAGSENDWTTAIHIAASEGDVNMIRNLLNHCPDCCDMLNSNNQNALHVTSLNNQDEVIRFLLDSYKCGSLVDEPDRDGNTPLHLFAASGNHLPELINHPRAKKMSFNKENQTLLDIALSCTATTKKRDFEVKRTYEYMPLREDDHDKAEKADQTVIEIIMKSDQFHIVVATLIMTITFAAGITLPGGFESDPDSPNKGMEILIRKTTFLAFVVSNAIAFTFSSVAIFIYFIMASVVPEPENEKIIQKLYDHAAICQCLSMLAVVIAFATVTPKGNTVLHVSALYGRSHFVREVLKITPPMLCCQNKKNETALGVIHVLLAHIEDHNTKEKRMRMTDASGDTALHKAVRSQRLDVVKLLVKEDPEFEFPPNHAQETPLYLAAESGFHDALINILGYCKK
ncbi:putative ankyrin repeat-containing protein-like isoform 2 [Capsicum annuum]|nr:putative ankyrin repeat-containing protein-like isoform 2 [Capsicum annuum]